MIEPQLVKIALAFFRLSPLIVVTPAAFFLYAPVLARLVICAAFACLLASFGTDAIQVDRQQLAFYAANEFLIGVALSLGITIAYGAINFFSQLIDLQIGFSAAAAFDPASQQMQSGLGMLLGLFLTYVLISSGFFETFIAAFCDVLTAVPIGSVFALKTGWYKIFGVIFTYAFALFSPVILALFLIDVCLAIVSRSMPQAQIYFVALPLKVFFGLLIFSFFVRNSSSALWGLLNRALGTWDLILRVSA